MQLPNSKKQIGGVLIFALLGILAGVLLLVLNADLLIRIVFVILGVVTVISAIPGLTAGLASLERREGKLATVTSLISVVVGLLMIFWHSGILMFLLGLYMILLPLIGILLSANKGLRFRAELPKMILGVVLLLAGPAQTLGVLFDVAGWCLIGLTVICTAVTLISFRHKTENATGNRIFADTDGDGSIDTVYVDTTGDGKADTATRYRKNK